MELSLRAPTWVDGEPLLVTVLVALFFAAAGKTVNASDTLHSETIALQNDLQLDDQLGIGRITVSTGSQI